MKLRLDDNACDNLRSMLGTDDEPSRIGLIVGELQDEDGTPCYGLHAYELEYPEEGCVTIAEFAPPAATTLRMLSGLEFADVRAACCGHQEDVDGDYVAYLGKAIIRRFCEVNGLEVTGDASEPQAFAAAEKE